MPQRPSERGQFGVTWGVIVSLPLVPVLQPSVRMRRGEAGLPLPICRGELYSLVLSAAVCLLVERNSGILGRETASSRFGGLKSSQRCKENQRAIEILTLQIITGFFFSSVLIKIKKWGEPF